MIYGKIVRQLLFVPMLCGSLNACALEGAGESERFSTLSQKLDSLVADGTMPGSVTYVIEDGKTVYHHVNGWMDIEDKTPMKESSLFRLYSMSKPITSVAILILQEQGKLLVTDPVEKFIPAFQNIRVYESGSLNDMKTVAPTRSITIDDLLAHKSGITYHFTGNTPVHQYYRKHGVKRDTPVGTLPTDGPPAKNLQELSDRLAKAPLLHQPGEHFTYSYSTTLLGHIAEVASGESLDTLLKKLIFDPLGMDNTAFFVTDKDLTRFVTNYLMTDSGLKEIENRDNTDYKDLGRLLDGGGALVGTAEDYLAFSTMLANKGTYNGARLLSESSVEAMFTPHIDIRDFGNDEPIQFGYGFAIGSDVTMKEHFMPEGSFGWAGSGNTIFWVNPETKSLVVFMTQVITPPPFAKQVPFRRYLLDAVEAK